MAETGTGMIRKIYDRLSVAVELPWFVAFSGGKDSTIGSRAVRAVLGGAVDEECGGPPCR